MIVKNLRYSCAVFWGASTHRLDIDLRGSYLQEVTFESQFIFNPKVACACMVKGRGFPTLMLTPKNVNHLCQIPDTYQAAYLH